VYVTYARSVEENDRVASWLLKKYGDGILLDESDFPEGEETTLGRIILHDASAGMGPLYVTWFRK
jgi:hypothetical protein